MKIIIASSGEELIKISQKERKNVEKTSGWMNGYGNGDSKNNKNIQNNQNNQQLLDFNKISSTIGQATSSITELLNYYLINVKDQNEKNKLEIISEKWRDIEQMIIEEIQNNLCQN